METGHRVLVRDTSHIGSLLSSLPDMYNAETFYDVVFYCRSGEKRKAHRLWLSAICPFLELLFNEQKLRDVVEISLPDFNAEDLDNLLRFSYEGFIRLEGGEAKRFKELWKTLDFRQQIIITSEDGDEENLDHSTKKRKLENFSESRESRRKCPRLGDISESMEQRRNLPREEHAGNPDSGEKQQVVSKLRNILSGLTKPSPPVSPKKGNPYAVPIEKFTEMVRVLEKKKAELGMKKLVKKTVKKIILNSKYKRKIMQNNVSKISIIMDPQSSINKSNKVTPTSGVSLRQPSIQQSSSVVLNSQGGVITSSSLQPFKQTMVETFPKCNPPQPCEGTMEKDLPHKQVTREQATPGSPIIKSDTNSPLLKQKARADGQPRISARPFPENVELAGVKYALSKTGERSFVVHKIPVTDGQDIVSTKPPTSQSASSTAHINSQGANECTVSTKPTTSQVACSTAHINGQGANEHTYSAKPQTSQSACLTTHINGQGANVQKKILAREHSLKSSLSKSTIKQPRNLVAAKVPMQQKKSATEGQPHNPSKTPTSSAGSIIMHSQPDKNLLKNIVGEEPSSAITLSQSVSWPSPGITLTQTQNTSVTQPGLVIVQSSVPPTYTIFPSPVSNASSLFDQSVTLCSNNLSANPQYLVPNPTASSLPNLSNSVNILRPSPPVTGPQNQLISSIPIFISAQGPGPTRMRMPFSSKPGILSLPSSMAHQHQQAKETGNSPSHMS